MKTITNMTLDQVNEEIDRVRDLIRSDRSSVERKRHVKRLNNLKVKWLELLYD